MWTRPLCLLKPGHETGELESWSAPHGSSPHVSWLGFSIGCGAPHLVFLVSLGQALAHTKFWQILLISLNDTIGSSLVIQAGSAGNSLVGGMSQQRYVYPRAAWVFTQTKPLCNTLILAFDARSEGSTLQSDTAHVMFRHRPSQVQLCHS